jgi:hypothetical protein
MKTSDGTWDVRCPPALGRLFPKRSGYYFRVDGDTAKKVLHILSSAYGIPAPGLCRLPRGEREHAQYEYEAGIIYLRSRNHLKTVFHEFYHHLDNMTDGMYDSDDRQGGTSSLAWMFAELLWKEFTSENRQASKRGAA